MCSLLPLHKLNLWGGTPTAAHLRLTMKNEEELKRDIVFGARLRGRELQFHSTWGLFSPRRIDDGSRMLVEKIELAPDHTTLDLGCGYGALGVPIAAECPAGQVHMADKDFVAVEYAKRNAAANGLTNCRIYLSNAFSHVPDDVKFDIIASNLPANVGKELLYIMLSDASERLKDGGKLYVVTISGLRAFIKRNFVEILGNYGKAKQGRNYTVSMAVKGAKSSREDSW